MGPFASPGETAEWLAKQVPVDILLVGHNPHMEMLASYLVSGSEDVEIRLKKASICKISFDDAVRPGKGTLEYLMQPAQLLAGL